MKALLVDDSKTTRLLIGRILRECGLETHEAGNGREALERLAEIGGADVALVDWNMPGMTGIEFVRVVRAESAQAAMKIMMVTTESEAAQVNEALDAGANAYAFKPFTRDQIRAQLAQLGLA